MKWLFKHLQNLSKRKSKRFWGRDKALVSFAIPHTPDAVTLGQVIDINERGISFRYIAQDVRTEGLEELKLFGYGDSDAPLEKMPVRIIYDIEMKKKYFLSLPPMRRCGAEFGELSIRQLSQLKSFIKKYAVL